MSDEYSIIVDIDPPKKTRKINRIYKNKITKEVNFEIPLFSQFKKFKEANYTVSFLKDICKHYKLVKRGNKDEVRDKIYDFLFKSYYAVKIQKNFRRYLINLYYKFKGPIIFNTKDSTNDTDFFTLENISEISHNELFSFKDNKNIWAFNIVSIYNLFVKSKNKIILNPYTRDPISNIIFHNIRRFIRLSKCLNKNINITINENENILSLNKKNEIKTLELFQLINELGNYSDHTWFLNLNRIELIKFIRELYDIWNYRAQLSNIVKSEICSPYGNPFRYIDVIQINHLNFLQLQKNALSIISQFITKGTSNENCNLGAMYVLSALTLVNVEAANSMPWLFQSVSY